MSTVLMCVDLQTCGRVDVCVHVDMWITGRVDMCGYEDVWTGRQLDMCTCRRVVTYGFLLCVGDGKLLLSGQSMVMRKKFCCLIRL